MSAFGCYCCSDGSDLLRYTLISASAAAQRVIIVNVDTCRCAVRNKLMLSQHHLEMKLPQSGKDASLMTTFCLLLLSLLSLCSD